MARAKKLDYEYYQVAKDILREITGLPKSVWEEVSSGWKEYFRPDAVTLFLRGPENYKVNWRPYENMYKKDPTGVIKKYNAFLKTFPKSPELKKAFPNAEIIIKDFGYTDAYRKPVDSLLIVVPQTDIEAMTKIGEKPDHDIISFWATSVGDGHTEVVAYGAKITTTDGWKFPEAGTISRIQKKLGESRFTHYYCKGATKSFTTYNSLVKYLKSLSSYINPPSEQRIIDSGYDESYYID